MIELYMYNLSINIEFHNKYCKIIYTSNIINISCIIIIYTIIITSFIFIDYVVMLQQCRSRSVIGTILGIARTRNVRSMSSPMSSMISD